jgi:hypothetical protein
MAKRKTLRERAETYWLIDRLSLDKADAKLVSDGWLAGYHAGARSTRISAAQRRVVAAAERCYREGYNVKTWDAFGDALKALERAKGDRK